MKKKNKKKKNDSHSAEGTQLLMVAKIKETQETVLLTKFLNILTGRILKTQLKPSLAKELNSD